MSWLPLLNKPLLIPLQVHMSHMKQSILSTSIWARLLCYFLSRAKRQHCVGFFHKRVKLSSISGFSTGKPGMGRGWGIHSSFQCFDSYIRHWGEILLLTLFLLVLFAGKIECRPEAWFYVRGKDLQLCGLSKKCQQSFSYRGCWETFQLIKPFIHYWCNINSLG